MCNGFYHKNTSIYITSMLSGGASTRIYVHARNYKDRSNSNRDLVKHIKSCNFKMGQYCMRTVAELLQDWTHLRRTVAGLSQDCRTVAGLSQSRKKKQEFQEKTKISRKNNNFYFTQYKI